MKTLFSFLDEDVDESEDQDSETDSDREKRNYDFCRQCLAQQRRGLRVGCYGC